MTTIDVNNVPSKTLPTRADKLLGVNSVNSTTAKFLISDVRQYFMPEDYGAKGDGTTDDTIALNLCADAAANSMMALRPAAVYMYSGAIQMREYSTLIGNGATLMRKSGTTLVSTTLTEIPGGSPIGTTVRVADPTKFIVGMHVSIDDNAPDTPGGVATNFTNIPHKITNISGDTLTLAGAFAATPTFPIGSYIRMSTAGLVMHIYCKVSNLILDGNRANNKIGAAMWGFWIHHQEIYTNVGCIVENCEVKNGQSEGVAGGYNKCIIQNNYIHDCAGNGVHLSGSNDTNVIGNTFYNNNLLSGAGTLLTQNTGHNDGHITFSSLIYRTVITGNHFNVTSLVGIGSYSADENRFTTVANNFFTDCANGPMNIVVGSSNVLFANNQIKDCGTFNIDDTNSTTNIQWIQICNNYFDNTGLRLDYVNHPMVVGNSFNCPLIATPLTLTNCSADAINEHNLVVSS
jgi:parallel beta-helix repeat protein